MLDAVFEAKVKHAVFELVRTAVPRLIRRWPKQYASSPIREEQRAGIDKYRHILEDPIMDETSQQSEEIDHRYAQRDLIRQSLNEIANDLSMEMRDAALDFPVYMTVPKSGDSLATIATPLDPTDEDWSKVSEIVCRILQKRIGGGRLRGRELTCVIANASMAATDVTAE